MQPAALNEACPSLAGNLLNAHRLAADAGSTMLKRNTERLTLLGSACSSTVIVALSALFLYQVRCMVEAAKSGRKEG